MSFLARGCLLVLLLVPVGCGGPDASSSTTTARVKGKVIVGGKPLARAEIRFNPSNINRKEAPVAAASLGEDGAYEITTLVGENQISLTGQGVGSKPQLMYFSRTFEVQPGGNELILSIP